MKFNKYVVYSVQCTVYSVQCTVYTVVWFLLLPRGESGDDEVSREVQAVHLGTVDR